MRKITNCPVAVVGGAGFLGSHMVDYLVSEDCTVHVVDNLVVGHRSFINPKAKFHHHDITESEVYLYDIFKSNNIQYVFNYAAFPYIPDSYVRPIHVCNVNFMGAMKVINAAHEAGARAILQVSSAEVYGQSGEGPEEPGQPNRQHTRMNEQWPVIPHSSYGASKAAIDSYCQVAFRERGTPVIALRQFNCVGERETHPYVIPEIISQLACDTHWRLTGLPQPRSRTVHLGNNSTRDFMYAGDAVALAVELLEWGQFGEFYNLGSESAIQIYDLARLIGRLMGFWEVSISQDPSRIRPWEIWHLQSDNTKLYKAISGMGTRPDEEFNDLTITPLEESLRRTLAWYKSNNYRWPWESPR